MNNSLLLTLPSPLFCRREGAFPSCAQEGEGELYSLILAKINIILLTFNQIYSIIYLTITRTASIRREHSSEGELRWKRRLLKIGIFFTDIWPIWRGLSPPVGPSRNPAFAQAMRHPWQRSFLTGVKAGFRVWRLGADSGPRTPLYPTCRTSMDREGDFFYYDINVILRSADATKDLMRLSPISQGGHPEGVTSISQWQYWVLCLYSFFINACISFNSSTFAIMLYTVYAIQKTPTEITAWLSNPDTVLVST